MNTIDYDYIEPGEAQYTDKELRSDIVSARYDRAVEECDRGCFLLEAEPSRYYSEEEIKDAYECGSGIKQIKGPGFSKQERLSQIHLLDKKRTALGFMYDLQKSVHDCLTFSYRERFESLREGRNGNIVVGDRLIENPLSSRPERNGDSGKTSLALLASPGCGKTSAICSVLSKYPQHIVHDLKGVGTVHQITYLTVECPAHSDIQGLLDKIGIELDSALGNFEPFCAKEIYREKKIEGKRKKLCDFIRSYNIGAIVIDEIQNMDFTATSAKSYNTFLSIINETKVCMFLVGQIDAYEKMAADAQVERRVGHIIIAQDYCFDNASYTSLVNGISTFSWRDNGKKLLDYCGRALSDDEINALHIVSSGTIHLTMKCWELVQEYGIETGEWPELTYKFLHNLLRKFSPNLEKDIRNRFFINAKHLTPEAYEFLKNAERLCSEVEEETFSTARKALEDKQKEEEHKAEIYRTEILAAVRLYNGSTGRKWTDETLAQIVDNTLSYRKYNGKPVDVIVEACKAKLSSLGSELQTKGNRNNSSSKPKKKRESNKALLDVAAEVMAERESLRKSDEE